MTAKKIEPTSLHEIPSDIRKELVGSAAVLDQWNAITPLARNEWVCWITSPKKPETRVKRLLEMMDKLSQGERRPCCWPGCPHHNPKTKKWH